MTYNSWTNYETWSVALVVDNDERTAYEAREIVAEAVRYGEPSEFWTEDERRRYRVADALKDWIERASEEAVEMTEAAPLSYLWAQMISAALSEVDWDEIARHYVEDYAETEDDEEDEN